MQRLTGNPVPCRTIHESLSPECGGRCVKSLWVLLLASTIMLSACGGGASSGGSQVLPTVSGNWQFTMAEQVNPDPTQPSFTGGLQGGFLVQDNGPVTGTVFYSVTLQPPAGSGGTPAVCSSGSASISGTISGQTVTLTEVAGAQTFNLTGTLSLDGSTMTGSYTSTDGVGCGVATTQTTWNAILVPPLQGSVAGSFHSTGGASGLSNRDFPVSGFLNQGQNTGASDVTVTGTLNFANYPCLATASVKGQISGNTVVLQLLGTGGSSLGQIGASASVPENSSVTFDSTTNGYVLHSLVGTAYAVTTQVCPGSNPPGDEGYVCLALGTTGACQEPVTLSPAILTFPAQKVGSSTAQTITLANNDPAGIVLSGLTLAFTNNPSGGAANFTVTGDTCDIPPNTIGSTFSLLPGQFCKIAVTFNPQSASVLTATLTVNSPVSADNNTAFSVPITGTGVSAMVASTLEPGVEASLLQLPPLTNRRWHTVEICLPRAVAPPRNRKHHAEIS
jgi:hypothetical protein